MCELRDDDFLEAAVTRKPDAAESGWTRSITAC
jgi:hypothetical protein